MRLIEEVVQALARMLRLAEKGDYRKALQTAESCYDLLGVPKGLADVADCQTLAQLLATPEKQRLMAKLLAHEAAVFQLGRDPLSAAGKRRRALELYGAVIRDQPLEADVQEMAALVRLLPHDYLPDDMRDLGFSPGEDKLK